MCVCGGGGGATLLTSTCVSIRKLPCRPVCMYVLVGTVTYIHICPSPLLALIHTDISVLLLPAE